MNWYQGDEEEEDDLMFSPALLARRASESWIIAPPVEVFVYFEIYNSFSGANCHEIVASCKM